MQTFDFYCSLSRFVRVEDVHVVWRKTVMKRWWVFCCGCRFSHVTTGTHPSGALIGSYNPDEFKLTTKERICLKTLICFKTHWPWSEQTSELHTPTHNYWHARFHLITIHTSACWPQELGSNHWTSRWLLMCVAFQARLFELLLHANQLSKTGW